MCFVFDLGAAFANSITGGLSTSIAVFCHELPHELGTMLLYVASAYLPSLILLVLSHLIWTCWGLLGLLMIFTY